MKRQKLYILLFIILLTACLQSPEMTTGLVNGKEMPTVVTMSNEPISDDGILLFQGEIVAKGKDENIKRGFYWSTVSNNPGKNDNVVELQGVTSDIFSYELKNASGEKTYYWKAFAENSFGIDLGEVKTCNTPLIWEEKELLSGSPRGNGAIFLQNNIIYMFCGVLKSSSWNPVTTTWEYRITTKRWFEDTELFLFPADVRENLVTFTIQNTTYIGTGRNPGAVLKDFHQFNPAVSSKVWTEITTPDDFEARYEAVAFSLNGKGYVVGGASGVSIFDRKILNDVWQYDPNEDTWKQKNNFPRNFYGGICISNDKRIFAGFGENEETKRILWEYNETDDTWSEFATLPDEVVRRIYSGTIIRNTIYIVDGYNSIWSLDLSEKTTWKRKSDLPSSFIEDFGEGGFQTLIKSANSNSIYVGLGFTRLFYEYFPLWDN